ncbi:MAG: glycosyltransferase [Candidatus Aenigmarchaeota archaeon]|nr:glycosyltransferase [Candidatus Aenigmarchaeota archaeon]
MLEIKQKAKKIKNLEFKGFLDKEDAFELIEKATVFVNTSELNREGFPNTFLESGDCFTPVVSLNSNPDNVLTKYNSGFHSNSFEQTIDDIKTLMKDEKLRDEMGLNNHNYVLKYHDANNIIKELEAVF